MKPNSIQRSSFSPNVFAMIALLAVCILISFLLASQSTYWVIAAIMGTILFTVGFFSPAISLYILIFSMLLSPEFGERDLTGEGFTIRIEDILLIVMGFSWLAKASIEKIGLVAYTQLNKPIALYLLACTFSTAWGVVNDNISSPITGFFFILKYFEYFVVFFITVNFVNSKSQLKKLLWALFITYVIVLILSFSQIPQGERITAPFEGEGGEPNTLGGYLVLMMALTIALASNVKRIFYRATLWLLTVLCFIAILFTLSRATWLALAVMYVFLIIFIKKRNVLIFMLILGAFLSPIILPKAVLFRFYYTFTSETKERGGLQRGMPGYGSPGGSKFDSSTTDRLEAMQMVLRDFPKHPIFGFGVTGHSFIDAQYHRVLIETGLVGLIAFLFLLWSIVRILLDIRKKYMNDPLYNSLSTGTLCAFFGLLAHSIGTNTFIIVRIMEPFWCLMGLNIVILNIEKKTNELSEPVST
ncbi:MAG: O-antigen ligase family protein [Candidatus Latescibacteria bacterium]|nr:O-antigen ligase family protein [Candidatus Latescibacterota bacterium]